MSWKNEKDDVMSASNEKKYKMTISRLTVDKLGVKLYDKVSAVIAELVSNSYDADATIVKISSPMGEFLSTKSGGQIHDKGHSIVVSDNGIGMTPEEVNEFYLRVGAERRTESKRGRGELSPIFKRRVMGRKGVGKLAPFGICEIIEIISSGGEKITAKDKSGVQKTGYRTAHLILDRANILEDTDFDYHPLPGQFDETVREETGTTIILRKFSYRRVSSIETFSRQLAHRFGLPSQDWQIILNDNNVENGEEVKVSGFEIPTMENSIVRFTGPTGPNLSVNEKDQGKFSTIGANGHQLHHLSAGFRIENRFYPVTGWIAYSRDPLKDDLMAGVRIYCRGKIAAQTTVFNKGAGFHGEHSVRSYLVGELHADWLDEEEDLIQTDRRDILWSHEVGQGFQDWGQRIVAEMGQLARNPLRARTLERFAEVGNLLERIRVAFPAEDQEPIRKNAEELGRMLGKTIRADEAEDETVVEPLIDLALVLAPHITLDERLREAGDSDTTLGALAGILRTARLAELSSFGRIAEDRLKVIRKVELLKDEPATAEARLQELLTNAPWLINPQWAPVSANQSFNRLQKEFETFYFQKTGYNLTLSPFSETKKRPDFVLTNQDDGVQIIEIKKPGHSLTNDEMDRIITYVNVMVEFFADPANAEFNKIFSRFGITLVCDKLSLKDAQKHAYEKFESDGILDRINWKSFLLRTEQVHQDFLEEAERQKRYISESAPIIELSTQ